MPPKARITKEQITEAAVSLVRRTGVDALNARALAEELSSSTQPIFSNFRAMDEVRDEVIRYAYALYVKYIERETQSGLYPPYKASGMGYIHFAKEEKALFHLLFMCDRSGSENASEDWDPETKRVISIMQENTGLSLERAELFHLEMWAYVHGIATMLATSYLELEDELICNMISDVYIGLKKRFDAREES